MCESEDGSHRMGSTDTNSGHSEILSETPTQRSWHICKFDPTDGMKFLSEIELTNSINDRLLWSQARISYVSCNNTLNRYSSAAVLVGKKIYMLGGAADYIYYTSVDILDTSKASASMLTWTQPSTSGTYLGALNGHTACLVSFGESRPGRTSNAAAQLRPNLDTTGLVMFDDDMAVDTGQFHGTPSSHYFSEGISSLDKTVFF